MKFQYSYTNYDGRPCELALIELEVIRTILNKEIEVPNSLFSRCEIVKNKLIELPNIILNSYSLNDLRYEPWEYKELSIIGGLYKDCFSINLGSRDRLIFKENVSELIIIEDLLHYFRNIKRNVLEKDALKNKIKFEDLILYDLITNYSDDPNLNNLINGLHEKSKTCLDKLWIF